MGEYIYINPEDKGFKKIKLTKKQHNKLFPKRKIKFGENYEYYISDDYFEMHRFYGTIIIILNTILFPVLLLFYGLSNFKETFNDVSSLYHQKKTGSFVSDTVWKDSETYKEIISIINKKERL